jgi:hypothetical protein
MTFQFLCPQGHLLQGEEQHMGMQCQCPQCGVAFIIPTIDRPSAPSMSGSSLDLAPIEDEQSHEIDVEPQFESFGAGRGRVGGLDDEFFNSENPDAARIEMNGIEDDDLEDELTETLLHIPCPNGHVLDVPLDMIGGRAMCPHCGAEFRLKREKSLEHEREQEIIDARRAKFWFNLAILAAGVVGFALIVMIVAIAVS